MYNKTLVYIAACIGMAFFGIAFIVMGSVLPALTEKYSLDAIGASSLVTFLPIGVLAGSLIFGPVVDRFGYKNLMVISTIVTILGLEGLSFFNHLGQLRFCIFLIGLGGGILNGETNALVSDIFDDKERSSRLSLLGVFYGMGALGIPVLLGTLSKIYSYEMILRSTGVFMIFCVVYFIFVRFPKPKHEQGLPLKEIVSLIRKPLLLILSFILFFQSGLEGLTNNWTTTYLGATTRIPAGDILFLLTFSVLGMTLTRLILGYFLQVIKPHLILFAGMIVTFIGSLLLYFLTDFMGVAVSMFLIGSGLAGVFPIVISYIGTNYKGMAGTAIGFALFIALSGNSLLNYMMGFVSEKWGISFFPLFLITNLTIQASILLIGLKKWIKN